MSTTTQDWKAGLPEEIRGEKSLESIKDLPSLAKSYIESQKYIGGAVKMPKADAPDEEWQKVYPRLGRPETPDKYELNHSILPDWVQYDEKMETVFKAMAHKVGLHPRQAQGLLDGYIEVQAQRLNEYTKMTEEGVGKLKTEWGANFDKNISMATRAVKELGGDELKSILEETGLGNHPTLIKLFVKLGESMGEDTVVIGDASSEQGTRDAVQLKIESIRNDPKHPYNNSSAGYDAHEAAVRQMAELYKQLAMAE
jgi:hypothetical protein